MSIELQQVPAIRQWKEERAGLKAGTINVTVMFCTSLRLVCSVGLLVSANASHPVLAVDKPKPRMSFGCE